MTGFNFKQNLNPPEGLVLYLITNDFGMPLLFENILKLDSAKQVFKTKTTLYNSTVLQAFFKTVYEK
jgi:hypothetical protein